MAERTAPNQVAFIETRKALYPEAWEKCKNPGDDGEFIKLVAEDLNFINPRFGLNAKRDGPAHDFSKDCLAYYVGPTDRHVEVYDVIGGHESSGASITWQDQTNYSTIGNPGTARFVHPVSGGGYNGPPVGVPQPVPDTYTINEALNYLTLKKGAPLSGEDINRAIARATELGWTGTPTIAKSIIHQIGDEFWGDLPDTIIEATLTKPFATYPTGTKVKITIG